MEFFLTNDNVSALIHFCATESLTCFGIATAIAAFFAACVWSEWYVKEVIPQ